MRLYRNFPLALLLAASSVVQVKARNVTGNEPCAQVSQLAIDAVKANVSSIMVPGELAHSCLLSMPFDSDRAVAFIDEYRKYLQFHSTIEILKNPPSDYLLPGVDLLGGLDKIQKKAADSTYHSQYEFDTELNTLIASANDGHLSVGLCSTNIFHWQNNAPLVSVSTDGLELPQVYLYGDAYLLNQGERNVSPVVSVNGIDVAEYIEKLARTQPSQDPDAQYNEAFPSNPRAASSGVTDGFWVNTKEWPGASLTLKFENDTSIDVETTAQTSHDLTSPMFRNGTALFEKLCVPPPVSPSSLAASWNVDTEVSPRQEPPMGYPEPILRDDYNLISGYFLNETDLEDLAVLAVPSFSTSEGSAGIVLPGSEPADYARIARMFITTAAAVGKKKILIDVSGNGGGNINAGFNLFKNFFPEQEVSLATRFRAHEGANLLGKAYAGINRDSEFRVASRSPYAYRTNVKPDQHDDFASWEDLYGPHELLGLNSSSLLASGNFTWTSDLSDPISGYGSIELNPEKALFAAEDIAIITDGHCASTCATFVEVMKQQGVRSIVFGGRPQNGPMQALGGVKGHQTIPLEGLALMSLLAHELAANSSETDASPLLTRDEIDRLQVILPIPTEYLPLAVSSGSINLRNSYKEGDYTTPLQFVYEAAECRLFYTMENYLDQESVWVAAARSMFGRQGCVQGSVNGRGSLDVLS